MKRFATFHIIIYLMTAATMLCAELGFAQTDWVKHPENPVLDVGPPSWAESAVSHPSVILDNGIYRMWYAGAGKNYRLGYATSEDGIHWTKYENNPILNLGSSGTWDDTRVSTPSVIFEDGVYKMWYAGYDGATYRIGYATSEDGIAWTKYEDNPVLDVGLPNRWDDAGVTGQSIIFDGDIYKMWYTGYDGTTYRIGYATSEDGIHWTKYEGNPILYPGPADSWDDEGWFGYPSVILDNGIYRMWYDGNDSKVIRIGYATSEDGIHWTKYIGNPVLHEGPQGTWDRMHVWRSSVIKDNGIYKMWYSGEDEKGYYRIGYATSSVLPCEPGAITVKLYEGINLMSVPMKMEESWRLSDLARHIGQDDVRMIISYDYEEKKFIAYLPATTPENARVNVPVQCGEGYIVVMSKEKKVAFEGYNCADEVIAAPSWIPLIFNDRQKTSIFVVTGGVMNEDTGKALDDATVTIRNLRTGQTLQDTTGAWAGNGRYIVTYVASSEEFMTRATDKLEITAWDANHRLTTEPVIHTLTPEELENWALIMPLRLSLPKQTALLQNYPNPFNPETWLPYQLAQDADVTISIYNIKGQLIRSLHLGSKNAGVYTTKDRAAYWDGRDNSGQPVASGAYFYTLEVGEFRTTRKMVIVK
jgi:predicted GH43/DUF377 family glycosyl hydrolase